MDRPASHAWTPGPAADLLRWQGPDGIELVASRWGAAARPETPAVLLLHGLASNRSRWREFAGASRLTARHLLLAPDLRGHGDSPTLGPIGLERWSADLLALLDVLSAPRGVLIGHSLGAQVAMHLAAAQPRRVAALVLVDPVFRQALKPEARRRAGMGPVFGAGAAVLRTAYRLGLRRREIPPLDLHALDLEAREALRTPEAERAFIARYSSARADLRHFRTAHYLQEMAEMAREAPDPRGLPMPTLVLLSTGATFAELEDSRRVAERFPRGTVDTVDCHHWPLTERPDEVRERIDGWVDALGPPALPGGA